MKIYDLGPFRLDIPNKMLTKSGATVALGPHAIGVLSTLIEHAPGVASKASIIDAVWPNVVVEESNLATQIYTIRRALGQVPGGDRWIETLSGRGYRYVGPIAERSSERRVDDAKRSNLPEPLSTFVGRDRELVELKRVLTTKRLVTIQGMGGIGKTRLALQVAAEVVDAYRDGVWIVELASIRDPSLVMATVGQLFGMTGRASAASLCAYLKARQLLLLLDNCEHVLQACVSLADGILRETHDITIIATSREPLGIAGEQSYTLHPLSLPDAETPEAVQGSEAVQLFVERVQERLPSFALTPDRIPAVAGICIHLDGIPLALELAAARARSLSVEQINARLGDRFRLLTGGSRAAPPRQQTLRATLDWSYDLLGESERTVLRRLCIFPGSFTIEAGCAIASDETIDDHAVLDVISQLVSRSLVIADTAKSGTRYRLLETTRSYGLEKLDEAQETAAMRRKHAHYFRERFDSAPSDWMRMSDTDWRALYAPDLDDVRAALDWSLGIDGDPALSVALAGASGPLWTVLSLYGEGFQRLNDAVARVQPDAEISHQARLWLWLGTVTRHADPRASLAAYERAVALYRKCDRPLELALSNERLAHALVNARRLEAAAEALGQARPVFERQGLPKPLGICFGASAYLELMKGDVPAALRDTERARELFRTAGNEGSALETITNIAEMKWQLGDLEGAEASLREYIAMRGRPSVRRNRVGRAFGALAGVLTERGDRERALEAAREALTLLQQDGGNEVWYYMDHFALLAAQAGRAGDAARIAGYADACYAARQSTREPNEARARERLHAFLCKQFTAEELERLCAEGMTMSQDAACRLALAQ